DGQVGVWNAMDSKGVPQSLPPSSVVAVNGDAGVVVLDTDDIAEGAVNQYHTDARVNALIGAASVNALADVDTFTTAPLDGQSIVWNNAASNWVPQHASIVGRIGELTDVDTDTVNPTEGQVLAYTGVYPAG